MELLSCCCQVWDAPGGFLEQRECWAGQKEVGELSAARWIHIPIFPLGFLSFALEQKRIPTTPGSEEQQHEGH